MITFRLKSPSAKKDTPIRMHCYLNNEEIVVYTRLKINPLFWIKEDQRVTKDLSKFLHGRKYNFELTRLEGIGNSLTVSLQTDEKKTTKKNFKALFEEKAFNIKIRSKIPKLYTGSAFFRNFDNFMMYSDVSDARRNHFAVVNRMLLRYELYTKKVSMGPFKLSLETISGDTLRDFVAFLKVENEICADYPELYKLAPEKRTPMKRGDNRIIGIIKIVRAFINYCVANGISAKNPFIGTYKGTLGHYENSVLCSLKSSSHK